MKEAIVNAGMLIHPFLSRLTPPPLPPQKNTSPQHAHELITHGVRAGPKVTIVDSPVPEPNDDQVLIRVVVSGSNPKDWKLPDAMGLPGNTGDDIAGVVHRVGANVTEFRPGDRVLAFHEMLAPGGSYAEYALAWQHATAHLPRAASFEEAAAVPLAALTAAVGLAQHLRLPHPWSPLRRGGDGDGDGDPASPPLVVYGAASAVGTYVVQLAARANVHPLICVAGKSCAHVERFLDASRGDVVVDYRAGDDAVVEGIRKAAKGAKLLHAYDAVSEKGSYVNLGKVMSDGGTITTVLPHKEEDAPKHVRISRTMVGSVHKEDKDLGYVYMRYFAQGLRDGWFKAQPQEVVPGGLGGIQTALENLKAGRANAVKYVFRIADTK